MVRCVVGSILHRVEPLSYFSFQPVFHDWSLNKTFPFFFFRISLLVSCRVIQSVRYNSQACTTATVMVCQNTYMYYRSDFRWYLYLAVKESSINHKLVVDTYYWWSFNFNKSFFCFCPNASLSRTEKPAKAGTCTRDRRALQQLALNVHVKHSDLTNQWSTTGLSKAVVCTVLSMEKCI